MSFYIIFCAFNFIFLFEFSSGIKYITYPTVPTLSGNATTKFYPEVKAKTCLLRRREGPCRAELEMYYFDPRNMTCLKFEWGGCQGNGNRFDTKEQCLDYCLTKKNDARKMSTYCMLEFDYGFCFGHTKRWFYNRRTKQCHETIYSGCGGNRNNFYTQENCENDCLYLRPKLTIAPMKTTTKKAENKTANVAPGKHIADGEDGKDGDDGKDGKDGEDEATGTPGKSGLDPSTWKWANSREFSKFLTNQPWMTNKWVTNHVGR